MKNRTLYDVLDRVMDDYSYTLVKKGNKISITGSVFIEQLNEEVTYSKEFFIESDDCSRAMETRINNFKEEFKNKVVEKLKQHKEILLDDEKLIKRLNQEISELKDLIKKKDGEINELKDRVLKLEQDLIVNIPYIRQPIEDPGTPISPGYPYPGTSPWSPNPYPWGPQIWCSSDSESSCGDYFDIDPATGFPE